VRAKSVQGQTLGVALSLAAAVILVSVLTGHAGVGAALGAGLVLGSVNGFLIQSTLDRRAPILATSFVRLALFTLLALAAARLTGLSVWPLVGGIALAQLVMVGVGVRQGLRA
jgi:hypothetical protein